MSALEMKTKICERGDNGKPKYATIAIIFGIDVCSNRAEPCVDVCLCVCAFVSSSQNHFQFISALALCSVVVEHKNKMVIAFEFRNIREKTTKSVEEAHSKIHERQSERLTTHRYLMSEERMK